THAHTHAHAHAHAHAHTHTISHQSRQNTYILYIGYIGSNLLQMHMSTVITHNRYSSVIYLQRQRKKYRDRKERMTRNSISQSPHTYWCNESWNRLQGEKRTYRCTVRICLCCCNGAYTQHPTIHLRPLSSLYPL